MAGAWIGSDPVANKAAMLAGLLMLMLCGLGCPLLWKFQVKPWYLAQQLARREARTEVS